MPFFLKIDAKYPISAFIALYKTIKTYLAISPKKAYNV